MDRITEDGYYPESDGCKDCPNYGEPSGCNREGGSCDAYDLFVSVYEKLRDYEDAGMTPAEIVAMREELEFRKSNWQEEDEWGNKIEHSHDGIYLVTSHRGSTCEFVHDPTNIQ